MTKIIMITTGIMMAAGAANAQISFAPEIGLNLANIHEKYKDSTGSYQKIDDGLKIGVKLGVNVNIPVGDRLVVQPGLFYSIKGAKLSYMSATANFTIHNFDIPINIQYMFNDPDEGRFFVGIGPYVGIAFAGKVIQSQGSMSGTDTTVKLKFGNDYPSNDLRRFDLGGQVNAGYLLKSGIFFRGMYQQGLINLVPQGNQDAGTQAAKPVVHETNITISVGYMLGGAPGGKSKLKNPGGMNQD